VGGLYAALMDVDCLASNSHTHFLLYDTLEVPESNHGMVYKCVGMKDSIWPMVAGKHPGLIQMTLTMIPGYGRLVYDGVLVPPHGLPVPPVAGSELEASLKETVAKAKIEGRVISRLAQLEVEGGS